MKNFDPISIRKQLELINENNQEIERMINKIETDIVRRFDEVESKFQGLMIRSLVAGDTEKVAHCEVMIDEIKKSRESYLAETKIARQNYLDQINDINKLP